MGLDMYLTLTKSEYESRFDTEPSGMYPEEMAGFEKMIARRNFASMERRTSCQVAYWRKANAVHGWIVRNCACGVDDCRPVDMSDDMLRKLKGDCEAVLGDHSLAKELLPTMDGPFFGDMEYDEWYFGQLRYTRDIVGEILDFLREHPDGNGCIYSVSYEASW